MPSIETGACEPVGPAACPAGFDTAANGWGCTAVLPAAACTGATRATLGKTECVPVDDCNAAFPPPRARVVHDSKELDAAIESADPGATIALEAGTYGTITTKWDVTLVGRCASKVIVQGPGERGIYITQDRKITIRGMTITGFTGGLVAAYYGPKVDASHLVLSKNKAGVIAGEAEVKLSQSVIEGTPATKDATPDEMGASAQLAGKITLVDVDVRDVAAAVTAFDAPGSVEVRRSIVTYDGPSRAADVVQAYRGGAATIAESAVRMRESGFAALGTDLPGLPPPAERKPGSLRVVDSEVVQRGADRTERPLVLYGAGSSLVFERSTLVHQSGFAILAGEPGTSATLTDSVVVAEPTSGLSRTALMVIHGATATLTRTAIVDAYQNALSAGYEGSTLTLDHSLVTGTKFGQGGPQAELGGVGMAIAVGQGASLSLTDSAVVASEQFGILGDGRSHLQLTRSLVDGTTITKALVSGVGIAITGGAELAMDASVVRNSEDSALLFIDSQAVVQGSRFSSNKIGVHLQGTTLVEVKEPPRAGDAAQAVFFANVFENNATYSSTEPVELGPWKMGK